jgi:glycosyltransferase involved in cell wall biosynthesis
MTKPICLIQGPFGTRSGYGDFARDIIRHLIELDMYDVKCISMPWGSTPINALDPKRPEDKIILDRTMPQPIQLPRQPEVYINISVPNEWQPVGKYNIGITAGIETTLASVEWLEGCNRMDLVLAISEHAKRILEQTQIEQRDQQNNVVRRIKLEKPIEVLHNCIHTDMFKPISAMEIPQKLQDEFLNIKEKFCYLFVGHWLQGALGEDRKNVGLLVKTFCEVFKNHPSTTRPALILKTSGAGFSIMDREDILGKIRAVRNSIGPTAPNVYLLHGELSEEEMNALYNHPKVKVHVSFTKGEGFGRPLLEASMSEKPIIASGWSGHLDFLNPEDALLVGGQLTQVHESAAWPGVILREASWFSVDQKQAAQALLVAFKNYDKFVPMAQKLAKKNREQFNYDAIKEKTKKLFTEKVPRFAMPVEVKMKLPELKKIGG